MQAVTNSVLPSASPKATFVAQTCCLGSPPRCGSCRVPRRFPWGDQIRTSPGPAPDVEYRFPAMSVFIPSLPITSANSIGLVDSVVGPNVVPHDLPPDRDVQAFLIGRERNAVRERTSGLRIPKLLIEKYDLAILHEVEPAERQLSLRTCGGAAQARDTVREIDRAVGFDYQVVRSAETLAFETVGQHRARPILLYSRDIAVGHRTDDHSPLRVTRQPVRADEKGGGPAAPRLLTDIRKVGARVPGIFQENRDGPVRLPPVDDVVQHVAEQQIAVRSLLNPDSSFG